MIKRIISSSHLAKATHYCSRRGFYYRDNKELRTGTKITLDRRSGPPAIFTRENAIEACHGIKSGDRVFIQGGVSTPQILIKAMLQRSDVLRDVEICHIHTEGDASYANPEYEKSFSTNVFFIGSNMRKAVAQHHADYLPIFLSEIPLLFRKDILPLDVALVNVSPPDKHGFCSLGVNVDVSVAAVQTASRVIAQINPCMPRTHGDGLIHMNQFHAVVDLQTDGGDPLPERVYSAVGQSAEISAVENSIADHIAQLIPDRATLQLGIGSIPDAVCRKLSHHKDLGIHTEMFSDGILDLIDSGVITNRFKASHQEKVIASFAMGSKRLYDYIHDNPLFEFMESSYVNDTTNIRKHHDMIAINSAIEIDLTGQVCADSIGTTMYSGVGGQMDFVRGASLSNGGKPIFAVASETSKGESKIAAELKAGAGVVTTRAHVHYVVTEWGVADLYGKNLRQRAKALIAIAHPRHRQQLLLHAQQRFGPL